MSIHLRSKYGAGDKPDAAGGISFDIGGPAIDTLFLVKSGGRVASCAYERTADGTVRSLPGDKPTDHGLRLARELSETITSVGKICRIEPSVVDGYQVLITIWPQDAEEYQGAYRTLTRFLNPIDDVVPYVYR